jgi:CheY-like chemotaxis protein
MTARPADKKHILVVDDEPLICDTVRMILQLDGHRVDSASSGAQALDLFEPGKFDVIITDFFMPAMTGDKLAEAIKHRAPAQRVMMLTAFPEKLQRERVLSVIDLLLGKPFEMNALREAITECLSSQTNSPAAQEFNIDSGISTLSLFTS